MSQWNYFVTAHKPTAVTHAIGPLRFTSPSPSDIIVVRAARLEVCRLKPADGGGDSRCLEQVCCVPINGRVASLRSVSPRNEQQDLVLLCTEKQQVVVLGYNISSRLVVTIAVGSLKDAAARPVDHAPLCCCDPAGSVAAIYWYEGLLKVMALSDVEPRRVAASPVGLVGANKCFNTRMTELRILDIAFLHTRSTGQRPVLAVLHADGQGARFLSMWALDFQARDLVPKNDTEANVLVHPGSSKLVPVPLPLGGALVLGGSSVSHYDDNGHRASVQCGGPLVVAAVSSDLGGSKWLLGGVDGSLWLVHLRVSDVASHPHGSSALAVITVEHLGLSSPPSALVFLDKHHVFVGSAVGDAQLLRMSSARQPDGNSFTVEAKWLNLGPIVDFCVADVDNQGQNQIVTCSGYGRTGALHFVRIGIGVTELASLPGVAGLLGLWGLCHSRHPASSGTLGGLLVLSFVGRTLVLALTRATSSGDGWDLAQHPAPGLVVDAPSIYCSDHCSGVVLQATGNEVRAASRESLVLLDRWLPPAGTRISAAAGAPRGLLAGLSNGDLVMLHVQPASASTGPATLVTGTAVRLAGEAACLHADDAFVAAGLWAKRVQLLRLCPGTATPPELLHSERLPEDAIPRAALLTRLGHILQLLVGMGDGRLFTFRVQEPSGALSQRAVVCLGTQPIHLLPFEAHIFASGDRPMVIHPAHSAASSGQFAYVAANLRQVQLAAPFDMPPFTGCGAFVVDQRLMIGKFDEIQRIHVRTVPLGESPHRIAYLQQSNVFAVACKLEMPRDSLATDSSFPHASLKLVHGQTLAVTQVVSMEQQEQTSALAAVVLEPGTCEYLAVGTAVVVADEPEPQHGRVLLYQNRGGDGSAAAKRAKFARVAECAVPGAVYALRPFRGMLLGTVNNHVFLWRLAGRQLECLCQHSTNIIALHLQAKGDHILVGDAIRSVSVLHFQAASKRQERASLVRVALEPTWSWLTATAMLREDLYLCTDDVHNLIVVARGAGAAAAGAPRPMRPAARDGNGESEDSVPLLERVGQMHIGEYVNSMQQVALVEHPRAVADDGPAQAAGSASGDDDDPMLGSDGAGGGSVRYAPVGQVVWASVDGAIGVIISLRSEREFARLSLIQEAVSREALPISGLPHSEWRDCCLEALGPLPHQGFIDGDVLELLPELPKPQQQAVVDRLATRGVKLDGVVGLLREIEELARLH